MQRSHWALALTICSMAASAAAAPKKKTKAPPPEPVAVEAAPEPEPAPPPAPVVEAAPEAPPADAPPAPVETEAPQTNWTIEVRLPLGRYDRRRSGGSDGSEQLKTNLDIGPLAVPAIRLWTPLNDWLAWGGQLGGGFTSEDLDGGTTQKTTVLVELEAQLRLTPWHPAWGVPQLTVGVGGLFFDGRFIATNTSSGTLTTLLPQGKAELGALVWLLPGSLGIDFAGGAGYAFGPGQLHVGSGQEVFLQRFTIELGAGLAATF